MAIHHLAEDNMFTVKMWSRNELGGKMSGKISSQYQIDTHSYEKLGSVGVWACVGHGEQIWSVMSANEVFIREFFPKDRLAAGSLDLTNTLLATA